MVTIAALIDAPGLGKTVRQGAADARRRHRVQRRPRDRRHGDRARPGHDRGRRPRRRRRAARGRSRSGASRCCSAAARRSLVCVYLSHTYVWAAEFPSTADVGARDRARSARRGHAVGAGHLRRLTNGVRDARHHRRCSTRFEALLTESPWWLVARGRRRARRRARRLARGGATAAVCLALLVATGLWHGQHDHAGLDAGRDRRGDVALGVVVGVWMGRSRRADRLIRPVLDAGQIDAARSSTWCRSWRCSAPTRFTAIVAAVVFAAPVDDQDHRGRHPRRCRATTVEAATAAGSSTWQIDHQGAAADGARRAHARGQPGPDLRAVDGRRRRPGRRGRAGLRRRRRLLPGPAVRQGARGRTGHRPARRHARPHHPGGGPPTPSGTREGGSRLSEQDEHER